VNWAFQQSSRHQGQCTHPPLADTRTIDAVGRLKSITQRIASQSCHPRQKKKHGNVPAPYFFWQLDGTIVTGQHCVAICFFLAAFFGSSRGPNASCKARKMLFALSFAF
jgi:hypothetical protein